MTMLLIDLLSSRENFAGHLPNTCRWRTECQYSESRQLGHNMPLFAVCDFDYAVIVYLGA